MKKIFLPLGAATVAALLATACVMTKRRPQTQDQAEVARLQTEIERLQSNVKSLQHRVDELQAAEAISAMPAPYVLHLTNSAPRLQRPINPFDISGQFADPNHPPKIWGEGECNGWKYYIIPLNTHEGRPTETISAAPQPLVSSLVRQK